MRLNLEFLKFPKGTMLSLLHPPRSLAVSLCLLAIASVSTSNAALFETRIVFDDYADAFDTSGLIGPAGFLKAFPDPMPNAQSVTTIISSTASAGTTRLATLTHLDPAIDPLRTKGNVSAFINANPTPALPTFLGFGTDTAAPARLDLNYDFTTRSTGFLDAGTGNSHLIFSVFDTDGGDNIVSAHLAFSDLDGNSVRHNLIDLGVDVAVVGEQTIPFTDYPGIDFTRLASMKLEWENPGEAQYDGLIAILGAGTFNDPQGVPEPSSALALIGILAASVLRRNR